MNSSFIQALRNLAQQLPAMSENGREIALVKSAIVIQKIHLTHFDQSLGKILLIKSVGLFNAAIV